MKREAGTKGRVNIQGEDKGKGASEDKMNVFQRHGSKIRRKEFQGRKLSTGIKLQGNQGKGR